MQPGWHREAVQAAARSKAAPRQDGLHGENEIARPVISPHILRMTSLVEIEAAAETLPTEQIRTLVDHLQAKLRRAESRPSLQPVPPPIQPLDAAAAKRVREMEQWLSEMREIGRRIEEKSVTNKTLVELVNEGRD
jgi:hypothetical protein